jgi:mRNA-degrading endonuclease RelE of RelBE toxin-antitoxin system
VKLRILREAEEEAEASAIWYDEQLVGLGDDFLDELSAALQRIEDDPARFPKLETSKSKRIRRCRLNRFPYLIIFEILEAEIVVLAVAHSKRMPNYWRERE